MAGYAASATLHGAEPQFAFVGAHGTGAIRVDTRDVVGSSDGAVIEQFELVGQPMHDRVADWLASVGEAWSQLTFFLFDPESWR